MSRQAMNYLLTQMEQLGYLVRDRDDDDRRSRRIRLTERGHQAFRTIRTTVREIEREWERELGTADFAKLRDLLTRVGSGRAADPSPAGSPVPPP